MLSQKELLQKYGLNVRGNLGQHLLLDPNIQKKIVSSAEIKNGECVIEIGPGLGALTYHLLDAGAHVIAIEKDARFVDVLQQELGPAYGDRFEIHHIDVLKTTLAKVLEDTRYKRCKVVSNLPYYITAPILFHLLEESEAIEKLVVMMQREVANRLVAAPGTREYGRMTLAIRYYCNLLDRFEVAASCFTPKPEVASTVLSFSMNPPSERLDTVKEKLLFQLIKIGFYQRRKTFVASLLQSKWGGLQRSDWIEIFESLGFNPKIRGEALLLKDYIDLTHLLTTRCSN